MLGLKGNDRSVGYGKQCWLVWSCVEERGWSRDFVVEGERWKGRPKRTWKQQVEEEGMKCGLRREGSLCCSKWSVSVNKIAAGLR